MDLTSLPQKKNNKYLYVLILIVAAYYAFKCAKTGHDFEVFVYAGGKIIHGLNIYKPPFVQNLPYYYSPLFALLLSPLSGLPIIIPQLAWICLSYVLLIRIWWLSKAYFDADQLTTKQQNIWLLLAFFLSIRFILVDVGFVQMTTFLLWATLESMHFIKKGRNIEGAALLAFAINVKLLPLAFIPYLVYRNSIKAVILTVLFYGFYLFVPAIFIGWHENIHLIKDWFAAINPANKQWTIEADNGPSSLVAMVPVYITNTQGVLSFKRNFLNLDFKTVSVILNVIRLAFIALTLAFLGKRVFKKPESDIRQFWEMSYLFIVIPLIYPHQQQYAFVLLMPAFIYISWYFVANWQSVKQKMSPLKWGILLLIGINFTPIIGPDIISHYVCQILLYYRVLTMAVVALIPVLWMCKPGNVPQALQFSLMTLNGRKDETSVPAGDACEADI